MTAIVVRGLRKSYGATEAVCGIDFDVRRGEVFGLLGPNGAGKTTLMLHLNGVLTATSGTVRIGGVALTRKTVQDIRRRAGLVFQDPDDQLFMPTVAQDVATRARWDRGARRPAPDPVGSRADLGGRRLGRPVGPVSPGRGGPGGVDPRGIHRFDGPELVDGHRRELLA